MVATQAKMVIALGMLISMLAELKNAIVVMAMPVANMWCAQTRKPIAPTAIVLPATNPYPTIGRREKVEMICEAMPIAGSTMMYTHGCPNIQNSCCHSNGLPPRAAS